MAKKTVTKEPKPVNEELKRRTRALKVGRKMELTATLTMTQWYLILGLVEGGIQRGKEMWKAQVGERGRILDGSEFIRLLSFRNDTEELLNSLMASVEKPTPRKKNKRI